MKKQNLKTILFVAALMVPSISFAEWKVDFTRRSQNTASKDLNAEPSVQEISMAEKSLFQKVFDASVPVQDVVILNTEQGFIPSTVRVKEGAQYRLVIVNVNEKSKNISFVMDAFSEHHATYYGKLKTFYITPKKEGVYTFISPETSAQGRLVVHPSSGGKVDMGLDNVNVRTPASE